jgi:hypothetical protein
MLDITRSNKRDEVVPGTSKITIYGSLGVPGTGARNKEGDYV